MNSQTKAPLLDLGKTNLIRIEAKPTAKNNVEIWEDLKSAAQDVRLHKQGKLKLKTAQELLNEL